MNLIERHRKACFEFATCEPKDHDARGKELIAAAEALQAALTAPSPADQLARGQHLEGDAKLTYQQCIAVADMASQIALVHREFAELIAAAPDSMPLEVTGPGTAATMELLGDIMNGMDAVTSEDEWTGPIFEAAHARWSPAELGVLRDELIARPTCGKATGLCAMLPDGNGEPATGICPECGVDCSPGSTVPCGVPVTPKGLTK